MRKKLFINFSNHPSNKWSETQLQAAKELAEQVIDRPFPNIPSYWDMEEVLQKVDLEIAEIELMLDKKGIVDPNDVIIMVQGEFVFTHAFVNACADIYVQCYAATSERKVVENADGTKTVHYQFIKFRSYDVIF